MSIPRLLAWLTQNRTPSQTIAKNTLWLFAGQVVSRLLRAAIVIYAARALGAASWGAFSYALGIVTFLTVFSDIGVNGLLTREGARDPAKRGAYLGAALALKLAMVAAIAGGTLLLARFAAIEEARYLLPILLFVFAFDTLRDLGAALARALERMQVEALATIAANAAIVLLGFTALALAGNARSLAWGYALGSGAGLLAIAFALRGYLGGLLRHARWGLVGELLKTAWPFGLMGMLGAIMLNTDIVMLGALRTAEEVGQYAAAQKLVQLLYVLPTFLASSMFPLLARLIREDPPRAARLVGRALRALTIAAIPIAGIGILLGETIITLFFGPAYAAAIPAFKILMLTILLTYPSILLGNALFAADRQREFVWFVVVAALGNVGLNLLFIPRFGITGSAWATLATQFVTDSALLWRTRAAIPFSIFRSARR